MKPVEAREDKNKFSELAADVLLGLVLLSLVVIPAYLAFQRVGTDLLGVIAR